MKRLSFLSVLFCLYISLCFSQEIVLESFGPTFSEPVELKHAGDNRLFVVEKSGIIKILNSNESVNTTPFLNINDIVNSEASERGLLGLAFHPDYPTNPNFYVNYTNSSGDTVISRYSVSTNPDIANTTEEILLTISQPYSNHNGGCIDFGADGYLYIATGDGGSGGDPENRAQNLNSLLGKILRIDVDNGTPYGIPANNPYLNDNDSMTLPEIWAYGLRNPWKFSFDSSTNDLWIADVGQGDYEEINMVGQTVSGINYGWRCYEGNTSFNSADCPAMNTLTFPVSEYSHNNSGNFKCSITGGYVYRGTGEPSLQGKYFFADYCSEEIGILTNNSGVWSYIFTEPFAGNNWVTFGVNNLDALLIASQGGNIYKIIDDNLEVEEEEESETESIKIYPNPSEDFINVYFTNKNDFIFEIRVFSIQGKLIKEFSNIDSEIFEISTQNIENGFYIVEILDDTGNKQIHKIVINRL